MTKGTVPFVNMTKGNMTKGTVPFVMMKRSVPFVTFCQERVERACSTAWRVVAMSSGVWAAEGNQASKGLGGR